MNAPWQADLKEIKDRLRRTETRVTKWLESQGFETGVQRPHWEAGKIEVPSSSCSIKDLLSAIPETWDGESEIVVRVKGDYLMSVYLHPED
jgi:hypothetical protein